MALFLQSKSNKIFWGIGLFFVVLFLAVEGYSYYDQWRGEKRVEELANALARIEKETFDKKAADKIGGKTPQETLDMFIKAVESGDYELASKYMIIENQAKEEEELSALKRENNLIWFLNLLKKAESDGVVENNYFRMKAKTDLGPDYFIRFAKYPSDNWKIEKI